MTVSPAAILAQFRAGRDTYDIARALGLTEPDVLKLLEQARSAEFIAKRLKADAERARA
jgi:predicted transcriptional regulator